MSASDQSGPDPSDRRLMRCGGCGWDIECSAADAARYTLAGCPACAGPVAEAVPTSTPGPAIKNKRLVQRRLARGGVRVEVRRGVTGLGPDLALGLTDLSEDGLGVRLKAAVRPKEECEVLLTRFAGGKPMKLHGEVRWCAAAGDGTFRAGIRFQRRLARKDLMDLTK
jgi:PilZ domain